MAICNRCGAQLEGSERFCKKCGSEVTANGAAPVARPSAPPPAPPPPPPAQGAYPQAAPAPPPYGQTPPSYGQAPPAYGGYPPQQGPLQAYGGYPPQQAPSPYGQAPSPYGGYPPQQGAPPGMVAMLHQPYPGGPQQVYYMPANAARPHEGVMGGLQAKIRELASSDKLEGFSLNGLFKDTFTKRGPDAMEEYMSAGSSRTTPPLELVDTNWPKPWMFFRVLAGLILAYVAYYALFLYTLNEKVEIAIMVLATIAVPLATLTLIWELNTPRNVSIAKVLEVLLIGGAMSVMFASLLYQIPLLTISDTEAGLVEETSKLVAAILVTYGARGARYPYQLNGILFGAAVGAGFACSETLGYGLDTFFKTLSAFITSGGIQQLANAYPNGGVPYGAIMMTSIKAVVSELDSRAILAPFGHIVWTGIAAGAFWRVKGDRPSSASMLVDGRFLRAFIIPMVLHALWDSPLAAGSNNEIVQWVGMGVLGVVSWYILFTMIQQGLHQVRDMQKAQLQSTLRTVEATLGLGTKRPPMPMVAPGMAVPR